jgi:hypothetical protein
MPKALVSENTPKQNQVNQGDNCEGHPQDTIVNRRRPQLGLGQFELQSELSVLVLLVESFDQFLSAVHT